MEPAKAQASSSSEYAAMLSISVGRRPKRSAIMPKRNAPTGRKARVMESAATTEERATRKSAATAETQKTRMK
jgi:hypothetical protein